MLACRKYYFWWFWCYNFSFCFTFYLSLFPIPPPSPHSAPTPLWRQMSSKSEGRDFIPCWVITFHSGDARRGFSKAVPWQPCLSADIHWGLPPLGLHEGRQHPHVRWGGVGCYCLYEWRLTGPCTPARVLCGDAAPMPGPHAGLVRGPEA